jgi:translocation and assembly module TamB
VKRRLVIAAAVLFLVALPVGSVFYVSLTQSGLQLVASHVPQKIGRARVALGEVRGTLAGGFQVSRIEIEHERTHLILEGLEAKIEVLPLLWRTVDARGATLRNAYVEVRRRTSVPAKIGTPRFLPAGLVVRVAGARIEALTLIATNGRRFDTTAVAGSAVVKHRTIRIFDTAFDWEAMQVSGSTDLEAASPMRVEGNARIVLSWPGQPSWTIDTTADGDLGTLGFDAHITTPMRADVKGSARDLTSKWNWSGEARVHDFDVRAWGGSGALGRVTGALAVHGDAKGFGGKGPLTPAGLKAGAFETTFEGSYAARVLTARRIELQHPSGTILRGAGTVTVVPDGPRLNLEGNWQNFRWPLVGHEVSVRSPAGGYVLSGVWPFDWRASGPIATRDLAPMPTAARGRLAKDKVFLDEVVVQAFEGSAALQGEVAWKPDERWQVTGHATDVNPRLVRKGLPGRIAFEFSAEGRGFGDDGDFDVTLRNLTGRLRGAAASGGGKLSRRGETWQLDGIRLGLGRTRFEADGQLGREADLRFAVAAEDLSWLHEASRGRLNAKGRLLGTPADPFIEAEVHGKGLFHAGVQLGRLDAAVTFDARGQTPSNVAIEARQLAYAGRLIDTLGFSLKGTAAAHETRLDAKASDLAVQLHATGAFARGAWAGRMDQVGLTDAESLQLRLEAPFELRLSSTEVRAEWFCLRGRPGRVCADGDWNPRKWNATLKATDLPLRTLTAGVTPTVEYRGSLTVTARAAGAQGESVQGNLRADLVDARIVHALASGKRQSILLGSGLVTVDGTANAIDARVGLDAGKIGTIDGRLTLARTTENWNDMPLRGELRMKTAELGYVTLYAPQIDRAAGRLETDLKLSGTVGVPLVDGSIRLSEAELDQYQVNLALRDASLVAHLIGNALDFEGSARIGEGQMSTRGKLAWRNALPYGSFELEGTRLRVADVPEARIDASPDLDFTIDGRHIAVSGSVIVPYAKIVPTDLRNAVRSSSDEILVGVSQKDRAERFEVVTDIALTLADKVNVETSGLTGRLAGNIRVRSGHDEITSGTGELSVVEGKYTAYGRKLDIQRGRLIFTGGPVANPGVDIRAVKQFPEMVAGVNVRGTLLQPRLTFYSEPSLPQSQILSLILAGGALSSNTQSQAGRQGGAGNELLAQGGAIIAQQLGQKVGIEDVAVESNIANETSLVFGKYLSPRLYVSYGISLAESINTLKMRYSLNDRWTVRSEVGEARSADLVYTIQK